MSMSEPDELLMAQVASGRGESLEPLVRRHSVGLVSFLQRMTGDAHRAEELFQETFFAVWRGRSSYVFPRPFRAWLYSIAMNVGRAAFRSAPPKSELLPEQLTGPSDEPGDRLLATESATRIARAVRQLPEGPRSVVALRIWDGMSYTQIAEALGKTEATVRSHMSHALATLRTTLESEVQP